MSMVKAASSGELDKAAALMEQIRSERPAHWPNGLSPDMFDAGDLYLIYKQAGEDPVGFMGWQERNVGHERVGLYSIGVLPEYRNHGIAKQAVADLIKTKASRVDRIAALVAPGNMPSEKLAEALGVPVLDKLAAGVGSLILKVLKSKPFAVGVGATGTMAAHDQLMHKDAPLSESFEPWNWDRRRQLIGGINAVLGGFGGAAMHGSIKATGEGLVAQKARDFEAAASHFNRSGLMAGKAVGEAFVAPIAKDLMMRGHEAIDAMKQVPQALNGIGHGANITVTPGGGSSGGISTPAMLGGAALLAGALGLGAYGVQKAIRDKADTGAGGRLKVKLPTKHPGDNETEVDLPFNEANDLPPTLKHRLTLDTKRRLYAESKERIHHRRATRLLPQLQPSLEV